MVTEQDIALGRDTEPFDRGDIVIGAIAGDIVGHPYEFHSIKTTEFQLFTRKSTISDDTVMTIAILDALLDYDEKIGFVRPEAVDREALSKLFVSSMRSFGRAYPNAGYGRSFRKWLYDEPAKPYYSFGNGSAMRISPIPAYFEDYGFIGDVAEASAAVTHNHPEGIAGAKAVADAIFFAACRGREARGKEEIKTIINTKYGYDLDRTVAEIRPGYSFDVTCHGSIPEAIICFLEGDSFEEVLRLAVSLGGDSDTQAAIAGSIAAARYGVPAEIKAETIKRLPDDLLAVYRRFEEQTNPEFP